MKQALLSLVLGALCAAQTPAQSPASKPEPAKKEVSGCCGAHMSCCGGKSKEAKDAKSGQGCCGSSDAKEAAMCARPKMKDDSSTTAKSPKSESEKK